MSANLISVRLEIHSQKVREDLGEVIASQEGFVQAPGASPADLLILEIQDQKETRLIHELKSSGEARNIFLTSPRAEPELLIQALRAGAKEFFPQPIKKEEVQGALQLFREAWEGGSSPPVAEKRRGTLLYVLGSKGGVGTTTVAVNVASTILELDRSHSVLLMDLNQTFPEVPLFLDMEATFHWGELLRNFSRVDPVYLQSTLVRHSSGMTVLPAPPEIDSMRGINPVAMQKLLVLLVEMYGFIVIDGGQLLDEAAYSALRMADQVLLVSELNLPCLANLRKMLRHFQEVGFPPPEKTQIISNRHHKRNLITVKEAEESIKTRISWFLPQDAATATSAVNQGKPLSKVDPRAEICRVFREMTSALLSQGDGHKEKAAAKEKAPGFWQAVRLGQARR